MTSLDLDELGVTCLLPLITKRNIMKIEKYRKYFSAENACQSLSVDFDVK